MSDNEGAEAVDATGLSEDSTATGSRQEPQSVDSLPEWAQKELTKARNDAAKYRTEKRELKQQLENAGEADKKRSEVEKKLHEQSETLSDRESELGKLKAVLNAGMPADQAVSMASRVKGATEDEWNHDAAELASMFGESVKPERRPDYSQGAGNSQPLNGDPIEDGIRAKLGIN